MPVSADPAPPDEVVELAAALIRTDSTNSGPESAVGERAVAELVAAALTEVGGRPQVLRARPGRDNVVLRFPGASGSTGRGIVVHGHLDAVPADPAHWTRDPFGGEVVDGMLWGRGALDMKGADAVMLAVARRWLRAGHRPLHDVVFCWLADEEAGGRLGARWLCREHAELFVGCDTAVGEVGGFSVPLGPGTTLYPVMTAERARLQLDVTATGQAGHGAVRRSPITDLAAAVSRIAEHRFPLRTHPAVTALLEALSPVWRTDLTALPLPAAVAALGPLAALVEPVLRTSATPTVIRGGSTVNVVPDRAQALFDVRCLPDDVAGVAVALTELAGPAVDTRVTVHTPGTQNDPAAAISRAERALRTRDVTAVAAPYLVAAATDAPHFAALGLATLGFTPLALPVGFPYAHLFHGVDERVPVAALRFGVDVLDAFLRDEPAAA